MPPSAASGVTAEGQFRTVVREFFETSNASQFERTCDLMSVRF